MRTALIPSHCAASRQHGVRARCRSEAGHYRLPKRHPPPRFAGALRRSPHAFLGKNSTRSGYDLQAHGRHTQMGPSEKQPSVAMMSSLLPSGNSVEHSEHGW